MAFLALDTPLRCDLTVVVGQPFELPITIEDYEENPIDLTGCTPKMSIRTRQDKTSVKIADCGIIATSEDLTAGKMVAKLSEQQTEKIWHREGWYDLKIITPSEKPYYYLYGKIVFQRTVT